MTLTEQYGADVQRLRSLGYGYKRIAEELGITHSSARRIANPEYAERQRRLSAAAKRRRTGICEECGATTRYNGHGQAVSKVCLPCSNRAAAQAARGTGPRGQQALSILAEPRRFMEFARLMDMSKGDASWVIARLRRYGLVERVSRGVYRRAA